MRQMTEAIKMNKHQTSGNNVLHTVADKLRNLFSMGGVTHESGTDWRLTSKKSTIKALFTMPFI